jgi:hypothetical protein
MWQTYRHRYLAFSICCAFVLTFSLQGCRKSDPAPTQEGTPTAEKPREILRTTFMVEESDRTTAEAYYTETLTALGLTPDLNNEEPSMSVMLDFLGYADLSPTELEETPSAELMKLFGDDLLASAFFAPKSFAGRPEIYAAGSRARPECESVPAQSGLETARRGEVQQIGF